jgi:GH18 family chitinase
LTQGVPPEKIVIGLSGFGVLFKDGSAQDVSTDLKELQGYKETWDSQRCCTNYETGSSSLSVESPRSFQSKLDYAKELGLGGVFFWDIAAFHRLMYNDA